jgi:hypothetical protein
MTLSAVGIGNLALDELPHKNIVSLGDNVLAAAVITRQLPQVLGELLEMGEWPFAIERITLAELPTNDRLDHWGYAYAAPSDLAVPLRIIPVASGVASPYVGVGQRLSSTAFASDLVIPFDFEGLNLWTNEPDAVLEYVTSTPDYARFSRRFERILALHLAARICMPITKDKERKRELLSEAMVFTRQTMAAEMNKNPTQNTYGDNFIPSALVGHLEAPE